MIFYAYVFIWVFFFVKRAAKYKFKNIKKILSEVRHFFTRTTKIGP